MDLGISLARALGKSAGMDSAAQTRIHVIHTCSPVHLVPTHDFTSMTTTDLSFHNTKSDSGRHRLPKAPPTIVQVSQPLILQSTFIDLVKLSFIHNACHRPQAPINLEHNRLNLAIDLILQSTCSMSPTLI